MSANTTTTLLSVILILVASVRPEAVASPAGGPSVDLLPAEHRSEGARSAEPDSILESIATLFGRGPAPKKPVHRAGPVYRPQAKPGVQQQQQSIQRPVAVAPPATFNKKTFGSSGSGYKKSSPTIKRQSTGKIEMTRT